MLTGDGPLEPFALYYLLALLELLLRALLGFADDRLKLFQGVLEPSSAMNADPVVRLGGTSRPRLALSIQRRTVLESLMCTWARLP